MDFFHKDKVEKEMKTTWGLLARRRGVSFVMFQRLTLVGVGTFNSLEEWRITNERRDSLMRFATMWTCAW